MANEKSIFEQIIKDDPDNLLKVDLKEDVTQDSTLIDSFREINNFYEKYDREPSANKADFYEFQLYASLKNLREDKPTVILVAGVNGVGKTTTIGKLGKILKKNNTKILFGAADTFRAAAVSQLEVWSKKIGAQIIKSEEGADPASVAYKSLEYAKKENYDFLLVDTAGRMQNKKNLMDEFKKIKNVLKKIDINAPHETFLILDATTGQSAINQVEEFKKISPITGIIMTKLDGTAKGGILLAIGKKFKIPIVALGMGEKEDDLQIFEAKHYAKAIMFE